MADNKVEFILTAEEKDFIQGMKAAGVSVDSLKKKMGDLNATASDRKINKALNQDSAGDFLELLGISENVLRIMKTAGMTLGALNAVAATTTKILNGLREDKSASEIWRDIAVGIPIIGGAAKSFDDLGAAIGAYVSGLDELQAAGKREDDAIKARNKLIEDVAADGKKARDDLYVSGAPDRSVALAELGLRDVKDETSAKRKQLAGLSQRDISNEARQKALDDLAAQELAALKKLEDAKNKVAIEAADKRNKEMQKLAEDAAKQAKEKADAAAKQLVDDSALQDRIFEKTLDTENKIADLEEQKKQKRIAEQIAIGEQTRTGALATTAGLGTANQLASRERASNNPMLKLMKDQDNKLDKQVTYLKGILDLLNRGTDPQDIFGL